MSGRAPCPLGVIHDRNGRVYALRCDIDKSLWRIDVLDGTMSVGHVFALPSGDSLHLQDLSLHTDVLFPEPRLIRLLRWVFHRPQRPKDYRFCGLGGSLLTQVIQHARAHGFRRIVGKVMDNDFQRYPRLPDRYRIQGFTVEATGNPGAPFQLACEL